MVVYTEKTCAEIDQFFYELVKMNLEPSSNGDGTIRCQFPHHLSGSIAGLAKRVGGDLAVIFLSDDAMQQAVVNSACDYAIHWEESAYAATSRGYDDLRQSGREYATYFPGGV